ncbi:hypothetical protein BN1058_00112 [Paraliobacillus sp. PM-2]|uniref:hypothetical protein n=1 Tax=Paraliobacillus sp. PM-2 TaxID=1462524 RepID=UPI00061C9DA0|nr:hypothetical protein [Paraliobacillus sp. PM-2]CQR45872.1 hypothetical protein BN1058_00112 [Paraliobacillus sp. PM-2]
MAKKKKSKIQVAQEEVQKIKERIDVNTKEYKHLWDRHVKALDKGDVLEAKQLEHRYYYLQSTVADQLDRERVEALNVLEGLLGYKARLEHKLPRERRSLERKKGELESVKEEADRMIQHQRQLIVNAEQVVEDTERQLDELGEG